MSAMEDDQLEAFLRMPDEEWNQYQQSVFGAVLMDKEDATGEEPPIAFSDLEMPSFEDDQEPEGLECPSENGSDQHNEEEQTNVKEYEPRSMDDSDLAMVVSEHKDSSTVYISDATANKLKRHDRIWKRVTPLTGAAGQGVMSFSLTHSKVKATITSPLPQHNHPIQMRQGNRGAYVFQRNPTISMAREWLCISCFAKGITQINPPSDPAIPQWQCKCGQTYSSVTGRGKRSDSPQYTTTGVVTAKTEEERRIWFCTACNGIYDIPGFGLVGFICVNIVPDKKCQDCKALPEDRIYLA